MKDRDQNKLDINHDAQLQGHDAQLQGHDAQLQGHDAQLQGHDAQLQGHDAQLQGHEQPFWQHFATTTNVGEQQPAQLNFSNLPDGFFDFFPFTSQASNQPSTFSNLSNTQPLPMPLHLQENENIEFKFNTYYEKHDDSWKNDVNMPEFIRAYYPLFYKNGNLDCELLKEELMNDNLQAEELFKNIFNIPYFEIIDVPTKIVTDIAFDHGKTLYASGIKSMYYLLIAAVIDYTGAGRDNSWNYMANLLNVPQGPYYFIRNIQDNNFDTENYDLKAVTLILVPFKENIGILCSASEQLLQAGMITKSQQALFTSKLIDYKTFQEQLYNKNIELINMLFSENVCLTGVEKPKNLIIPVIEPIEVKEKQLKTVEKQDTQEKPIKSNKHKYPTRFYDENNTQRGKRLKKQMSEAEEENLDTETLKRKRPNNEKIENTPPNTSNNNLGSVKKRLF